MREYKVIYLKVKAITATTLQLDVNYFQFTFS